MVFAPGKSRCSNCTKANCVGVLKTDMIALNTDVARWEGIWKHDCRRSDPPAQAASIPFGNYGQEQ